MCKCGSVRMMFVQGKCSDLCYVECDGYEHDGYVPKGLGIGGGDYMEMEFCLDCGRIQGNFPITEDDLEKVFIEDKQWI